ncbi:unnamed protein product [Merluccius merluccius]
MRFHPYSAFSKRKKRGKNCLTYNQEPRRGSPASTKRLGMAVKLIRAVALCGAPPRSAEQCLQCTARMGWVKVMEWLV